MLAAPCPPPDLHNTVGRSVLPVRRHGHAEPIATCGILRIKIHRVCPPNKTYREFGPGHEPLPGADHLGPWPPPCGRREAPLMPVAGGEARKRQASATSSGVISRPKR